MGAVPNSLVARKDRLAGEWTDLAYGVAFRQGVQGSSADVKTDIRAAIGSMLGQVPLHSAARGCDGRPTADDVSARLTEAVYQVALRRGFRGPFVDLELGLWHAFRTAASPATAEHSSAF